MPLKATALVIPGGTPPGSEPRRGQDLHTFTSSQTRHRAIRSHPVGRSSRPRLGGISFLHRFGSALNHHVHLHACVTDGVFVPAADHAGCDASPTFLLASGATPLPVSMRAMPTPRKAAATLRQNPARTTRRAKAWAKLLARVGEEFPLDCAACGGDIRLIAFITEPAPIRKILAHLGEPLEPPPVSPARGPPTDWGELVQVYDERDIFQASPNELPAIDIHSL